MVGLVFFANGSARLAAYLGEVGSWLTVSKTTTYAAVVGDFVLADTSGGGWTLTLPSAVANAYGSIMVKKISTDGNLLTVVTAGGNIDGELTSGIWNPHDSVMFTSDATNWWIS